MLKFLSDFECKAAAVNSSYDSHLLDHIAPLACLLKIPLIFNEEKNHSLLTRYYPDLDFEFEPNLEESFQSLSDRFNTLISCQPWLPHVNHLFETLYNKKMKLIFCPHGQSDKGFKAPILQTYIAQEMVLLYGKLHQEMLEKLELLPLIRSYAFIGNYRLSYYQKHRIFYDYLIEKEIFSRFANPQNPTLLYAPTWNDKDASTSFFEWSPFLLKQLPSHWNLIVKPHPLLEEGSPAQFYRLEALFTNQPNVIFLTEFPLIYPLLNRVTAYLGDFSSVGYDFLYFQRPMFFFPNNQVPIGPLRLCGEVINFDVPLFQKIEQELSAPRFQEQQAALFKAAFEVST